MGFLINLLYVVFFLSAVLLIIVILLQEPKGGGLAEAFGGFGAETFGVRERGINKFTATVAGVFLASAVFIHMTSGHVKESSAFQDPQPPPTIPGATDAPPPEVGGATTKPG